MQDAKNIYLNKTFPVKTNRVGQKHYSLISLLLFEMLLLYFYAFNP